MPKKQFSDNHFLFILFVCALLLGQQSYKSLMLDEGLRYAENLNSQRYPAGASVQYSTNSNDEPQLSFSEKVLYDLICRVTARNPSSQVPKINVSSSFIHVKGKLCDENYKNMFISISNKTNGFSATTFELPNNYYRTDLIHLNEGENQINISYKNSKNEKFERLLLVNYSALDIK